MLRSSRSPLTPPNDARHAMNATDCPSAVRQRPVDTALPDWLPAGLRAGGVVIRAMQPYTLRATDIDQPALVIPLCGQKVVVADSAHTTVRPGEFIMMHRTFRGTIQNLTADGEYRAWCIPFPWRVIELARTLLAAHALPPAPGPAVGKGLLAPLHDALRALLAVPAEGGDGGDGAARDHALLGILLALARLGENQFRLAQDPTLAARIRMLVSAAPDRAWSSADLEAQLHMSGATLRRRLAAEQTSLRALVRDARLDHGMYQLQATRRAVKTVAWACGYRSVPSFRRQFAQRFGVDPALVGNGGE
jgi:AraC-like DNA-binding protein